ncbi:MAG: hypothetical protein ACRDL8_00520 [Solirubrobacteraceae bacterium]
MPTVVLVDADGQGRLGDDALLAAFVSALPGWKVVGMSRDPARWVGRPTWLCWWSMLRETIRADAVVFGGTVLTMFCSRSQRRASSTLVLAASLLKRKVVLLGVGAERIDTKTE